MHWNHQVGFPRWAAALGPQFTVAVNGSWERIAQIELDQIRVSVSVQRFFGLLCFRQHISACGSSLGSEDT